MDYILNVVSATKSVSVHLFVSSSHHPVYFLRDNAIHCLMQAGDHEKVMLQCVA